MRYTTATLAALALVALVAGGVSAAPTAPSTVASADVAQPANYTPDTVDPDDELTDGDVETARELAWANDSVRAAADGDTPVQFEVWAPNGEDDHVSVWVEQNETTVAIADIDLDAESVLAVDEPTVLSADETESFDVETTLDSAAADSTTVFEVTTDISADTTVDGESDE
ncbi:hypothetical protein [Halohasta salina]|uniref:hypothetical protein n=1 Tax=Halohasta salina TaxID=2961621 RepID=UPI0020A310AB|nr:hypothetical protein [Halohasta salina]